jgi:hypothetical protein
MSLQIKDLTLLFQKIERERAVWNSLSHDNILPFLGYCEDFGRYGALVYPVSMDYLSLNSGYPF